MAIKVGTPVVVDWHDAVAESGWGPVKDVATKPDLIHSLGYVLTDTDDAIVIAGDIGDKLGDDDTVNRTMVIPRGMVRRVRRL